MAAPRIQLFVNTGDNISNEAAKDIDTNKLLEYLDSNIDDFKIDPSNTLQLFRFTSGYMNAPYLMKYGEQRYVLRRDAAVPAKDPLLMGLKQGSTLHKTYDVMKAIGEHTSIPVPEMLIYCDNPKIIGSEFYVMKFVDGRIFYNTADTDTESPGAPLPQTDKMEMHDEIGRVLSDIHSVDPLKCGLLEIFQKYNTMELQCTPTVIFEGALSINKEFGDVAKEQNPELSKLVQRFSNELNLRMKAKQIETERFRAQTVSNFPKDFGESRADAYWAKKRAEKNKPLRDDEKEAVPVPVAVAVDKQREIQFLQQQLSENNLVLYHGDTQWENIIWHPTENRIIAMVDWEFCALGNPCVEITYNASVWSVFSGLNFFHFKGVKGAVPAAMVDEEFAKHGQNMAYILQSYAKQLKAKNRKIYDLYIENEDSFKRNAQLYFALNMFRFGAGFCAMHIAEDDELTEMGKALISQFPIGLGPYFFEVGSRFMGIVGDKDKNTILYNNENKAFRIVNELLAELMEYELKSCNF